MGDSPITIALAGNPNSGKTTVFNAITGAHQHVGNWPGVTVEKKEGSLVRENRKITLVDLPGTYSLSAYSIEEIVARNYILKEHPDVVVHILDASNLERNLYLTVQFLELDCPLVLALNMFDLMKKRGLRVDLEHLERLLGAPVVPTVGTRGEGMEELVEACIQVADGRHPATREIPVSYGEEWEGHITELAERIRSTEGIGDDLPPRWLAIKLLEEDGEILERLDSAGEAGQDVLEDAEKIRDHLRSLYKDEPEILMTERRYGFVSGVLKEVLKEPALDRVTASDQVDRVLTHRVLGLPVFVLLIWSMFHATFVLGAYPMEWIEAAVLWLGPAARGLLGEGALGSLVADGIIGGVGSVAVFLPNILILFLCISILEDSGYMARAAFLMDRVMHLLGLHGKSFIPMLMGFGCNVPAIMATRTLESHRDRVLTILINPLISCSARLPVYVLVAGAFFAPQRAGTAIFSIYLLGIVLAVLMGRLFSKTVLRGEATPFVMELPPYRMPTVKSSLIHMWDRGRIFLRKMGGVILVGSVVIWILGAYPERFPGSERFDREAEAVSAEYGARIASVSEQQRGPLENERDAALATLEKSRSGEQIANSYIGRMGQVISPVFEPLGFGWRDSVALLTGFVAKEIVVSTLGVLHQAGSDGSEESEDLRQALRNSGFTPLTAYAFMAFVLIYTPCLGTLAAIRRETNSWKWTAFSLSYSLILAWGVAFVIVTAGRLLGF